MTFREKLEQEYPQWINDKLEGGCVGCPSTFGYEDEHPCLQDRIRDCRACWDRQMPPPPEEKDAPTAPHEIPQAVRNLVEARIHQLTEQVKAVKALEAERDALCDWLNER